MTVVIVGRGNVGRALYRECKRAELKVTLLGRRITERSLSGAMLIIVAVPDAQIETVAKSLAPFVSPAASVVHCAGARSSTVLAPCKAAGASVGVMHPLVSFTGAKQGLYGATFFIAGDPRCQKATKRLARALGCKTAPMPRSATAYHAIAALVANTTASLAFYGVGGLTKLGVDGTVARRALGALIVSVGHNVAERGVPEALSGPVVRGDVETVAAHVRALARVSRPVTAIYKATVPIVVGCAKAAGLPAATARRLNETVSD